MTILITSDIHLNDNPRDSYRHRWMAKLPKLVQKHKANSTLILGDLTDEKDRHSSWLVNTIVDHFWALTEVCHVVILRGNHDYLSDANNPFYQFLKHLKNISWINDPVDLSLSHAGPFLFLPHTHDFKKDWKGFDFSKYEYIFTHNTFNNSDVGYGRKLAGISTDIFPKAVKVISGDVHIPQTLNGNIIYVGAPYTIDFGDSYDPRILLLKNKELVSIPCEGPQKRLIECAHHHNQPFELVESLVLNKGDILKIRYSMNLKQMDRWQEIKDDIHKWGDKHGYVIDSIQPVLDKASSSLSKKITPEKFKTDKETFLEYTKLQKVDEHTIKTGFKLLQEG